MESEIRQYIQDKGWQVLHEVSRELWLVECPFCHGVSRDKTDQAFSFNLDTGACKCFRARCEASADKGRGFNLWTLRQRMGDVLGSGRSWSDDSERKHIIEYTAKLVAAKLAMPPTKVDDLHSALIGNTKAVQRLGELRGLTEETIRRFKLGFEISGEDKWLAIPYFKDGQPILIKYRNLNPKATNRFRREPKGAPSILFNDDALNDEVSQVYITEGEIDAISLSQLGFNPVVSIPTGAGTFDKNWRRRLEKFDRIMLCYDSDEPGELGAAKASDELGAYRCYRVRFPVKDANKTLVDHPQDARLIVQAAMQTAESMGSTGMIHISDAIKKLRRDKTAALAGIATGYDDLDAAIGGLRHEFIVFTGDTGTGKTTFLNAITSELIHRDIPVAMVSPEMDTDDIARKQISMHAKANYFQMGELDVDTAEQELEDLPLWIYEESGHVPLHVLQTTIEAFIRRSGGKIVIVDHLDFLLDSDAKDERREINRVIFEICTWPKKYNITLILVVHPTKSRSDRNTGSTHRISVNDIQGSSKIKQLASMIIILHRGKGNVLEVEDAKVRWDGIRIAGAVKLMFDPTAMQYSKYVPLPPTRKNTGPNAPLSPCWQDTPGDDDDDIGSIKQQLDDEYV